MKEIQCVDCIVNFIENEKEAATREFVFELLFGDIYNQLSTKHILQLVISYAISLEAQKTLDCASKWIIINIGNEIIQNIFDQLVKDHFVLSNKSTDDVPESNLVNLAHLSPMFASLFMTILLDMLSNNLISNLDKSIMKLFNLFETWIEKNPLLPLLAYKANYSHFSSYMLNPLPGFVYVTVIYPLKNCMECFFNWSANNSAKIQEIEQLASKVQLFCLKLLKNLVVLIDSNTSSGANDLFKLLNFKNMEFIYKRLDELNILFEQKRQLNVFSNEQIEMFEQINENGLERFAQLLEMCWQNGFITCTKHEIKDLFKKFVENKNSGEEANMKIENRNDSLLAMILTI
jgi:hypothetical protein